MPNAHDSQSSFSVIRACDSGRLSWIARPDRRLRNVWSACPAGLRAAAVPGRGLHLDAWLLGLRLRYRRLLLGAWYVGVGTGGRFPLDPGILGLGWGKLYFPRRILGAGCRFLWRNRLWLRLLRPRI